MFYFTTNNILNPFQHGFHTKQYVTTAIINMLNYATNTKANRLIILLLNTDTVFEFPGRALTPQFNFQPT